jgi:hypothetical protein
VIATAVPVLVVSFVIAVLSADYIMTSPATCGVCHEIRPRVDAWRKSAHSEIGCYECHGDPGPAYLVPGKFAERARRLGSEAYAHAIGGYEISATAIKSGAGSVPDATCERCHQLRRKVTAYGRVIDHAEHAKKNMSCVSCHRRTAHPGVLREQGYAMMAACFACHGRTKTAKAPGTCDVCHTKDFDLVPDPHKEASWLAGDHGKAARTDTPHCAMCHERTFCRDCHGLDMPHPARGWEDGKNGHWTVAARDQAVCSKCHPGGANLCSTCHHQDSGYDNTRGPWVGQHFRIARERDVSSCFSCHAFDSCIRCHLKGGTGPKEPPL